MELELVVILNLKASHSLEERESPHPHRWEIQVGLKGDLLNGRVVSLTEAQRILGLSLAPLQNTFLNNNNNLNGDCQKNPTCENLALFLWDKFQVQLKELNPSTPPQMSFLQVALWDQEESLGYARVTP